MSELAEKLTVRLFTRFGSLTRFFLRGLVAFPVSRLRTRLWKWALGQGFAASNRGDWELTRTYLGPDCEIDLTRAGGYSLGLDKHYRGLDGYITFFETFREGFSDWSSVVQTVVAPAGNRAVAIADAHGIGAGSGAEVGGELSVVFTYQRGWLKRIQVFADSSEALASIGVQRRPKASVS